MYSGISKLLTVAGRRASAPTRNEKARSRADLLRCTTIHQVLRKPPYHALFQVKQVASLFWAVTFTRINDQFDRNLVFGQGALEGVGLVDRHAFVLFAVENQRRGGHTSGVGNGRTFAVHF